MVSKSLIEVLYLTLALPLDEYAWWFGVAGWYCWAAGSVLLLLDVLSLVVESRN